MNDRGKVVAIESAVAKLSVCAAAACVVAAQMELAGAARSEPYGSLFFGIATFVVLGLFVALMSSYRE